MNRRTALTLGATASLGALACSAFGSKLFAQAPAATPPAPTPAPASLYGRLPAISDAAISPDGKHIAMAVNIDDKSYIRIYDIDARRMLLTVVTQEGSTLRGVGWAENALATFILSRTLTRQQATAPGYQRSGAQRLFEYYRVGTLSVPDGAMKIMMAKSDTAWAASRLASLEAPIVGDPGFGRMYAPVQVEEGRYGIYRVNLRTGSEDLVESTPADTWDVLLDETGKQVARTTSQDSTNRWRLLQIGARGVGRPVLEGQSLIGAPPPLLGLLADGRVATMDAPEARDREALFGIDLSNGAQALVHESPKYDIDGAITDPWTRRVVGVYWDEDGPRQHFFEPRLESIRATLATEFQSGFAEILSWSSDLKRVLIFGERSDPGAYYVFEPEGPRLLSVSGAYPDIRAEHVCAVSAISYAARDGVRIPAYLTIPRNAEVRNLPLVVLVHGGPHTRDTWRFDYWSQFLASRGYLVLQPNFRGSSGYGAAWLDAGRREWGGRMQTDVEDGVAAIVRSGRADAKRVCIMGASYGGYAALAGVTLTPDRYACAVSVNGVADLPLMLEQEMRGAAKGPNADYWQLSIGNRREDAARIRSVSPAYLVGAVKAPVLLMHSTEDSVVPPEQTKIMARRLREAGKNVQVVELTGDDHWLSAAPTRTKMLEEIERFLATHLAAPAASPQAG